MKHIVHILRGILCALIFVLVLELCARTDDVLSYGAPFWGPYNNEILLKTDNLGKWGKPGARYEKWQLNSLGYRGPELQPGTVRIVCFGASETFGLYEAPDEEYPRQLERELNKLAGKPEFQVVNAAFPGETLPTAILRVPEVVSQIHPSYALIYPSPATYIEITPRSVSPARAPRPESLDDRILELRISERVGNLLKSALPKAVQTMLRQFQIERDTTHVRVMQTLPEANVERFREDLGALVKSLRAHGVEPVLVTHATIFGSALTPEDRDLLIEWRKFYPILEEGGFIDMERRMNQAIRETAACEKLYLIDAANEIPPGPEYFADMVHFTTSGAEIMAADLAVGLKPVLFPQTYGKNLAPSAGRSPASIGCRSSARLGVSNR
ncbi:MAG TPA: SGNH/GDSL hydrolase family protein [Candidatus Bathyarchaeia archaeon]|nr:SGNH/GDSL hydrolase family protein [Candidatus Bathyarchaeia archaeon]